MSTKIQWADETWNPVTGCTRVSEGCRNCYIEKTFPFRNAGRKFVNGTTGVVLHPDRLDAPMYWKKPRRVFVNSLSDLFHEEISEEFILYVFTVMAIAHWHNYIVLTKRPERMRALLSKWGADDLYTYWHAFTGGPQGAQGWPLPNVSLGVSVEDQATADERIPILLQTPAAVRFISAEPLLSQIDVDQYLGVFEEDVAEGFCKVHQGLDWAIVGGESGPGSRPCDVQWIRVVLAQFLAAGLPVFVKQLGSKPYSAVDKISHRGNTAKLGNGFHRFLNDSKGGDISEFPIDLRVRDYPRG